MIYKYEANVLPLRFVDSKKSQEEDSSSRRRIARSMAQLQADTVARRP